MWVLVRGGLGNQMFQLAFATALAERFGVEPAYVDLSAQARLPRSWALSCFGVEPTAVDGFTSGRLALQAALSRKSRSSSLARLAGALVEIEEFAGPPPLTRAPTLVSGYWQGPSYFSGHEATVRRALRFAEPPQAWQLVSTNALAPAVAIHVRRGDYVSDPVAAQVHLVCDANWYRQAWMLMQKRVPTGKAWVFSDDPDWAQSHLGFQGDVCYVPLDPTRPAWCDMAAMSRCDHFVISNSSFSWWAAYLGQAVNSQVIAPSRWFVGRSTADLRICPPNWTLL